MWNSSGIKDYFKYPSDCKYSLNLADYVITQQQKAVLKSSTATLQQVMDTADDIGFEAFKMLYELEGIDPNVAMKDNSGRAKKNYVGMGKRVRAYKKYMASKMMSDAPGPKGNDLLELAIVPRGTIASRAQVVPDPPAAGTGRFAPISAYFSRTNDK
ncbi:unnamed protein product [Cylindrotheca closterium]|uniref:Uncharacterized protein n=1 Tax=Cylindrotheca closterium TaxID=2856 RepID=A0AAD2CWL1_9STRA|nr:unnamed protein product [Cylindrotheca closterium]